jgi:hypothetical protein
VQVIDRVADRNIDKHKDRQIYIKIQIYKKTNMNTHSHTI